MSPGPLAEQIVTTTGGRLARVARRRLTYPEIGAGLDTFRHAGAALDYWAVRRPRDIFTRYRRTVIERTVALFRDDSNARGTSTQPCVRQGLRLFNSCIWREAAELLVITPEALLRAETVRHILRHPSHRERAAD
ncbi:hypothetical protein [Micromonospora sp. LOL_024]|uniref:hypothetical protein n=1 Tax=Micromonospora sp. LOL_024 TaxID=3345412 RepID=UPI003A84B8D6